MKNNQKNLFKCFLATLCIAIVFIAGFSAFALINNFQASTSTQTETKASTLTVSEEDLRDAYIVHGDNVYKYTQAANSTASLAATTLTTLPFNQSNTLKLVFIKDSAAQLSALDVQNNIASLLIATKTDDQIEISIEDPTETAFVDASLDAEYSFGNKALNAHSKLNFANGEFSIGEKRSSTSLTATTQQRAQIFTLEKGSVIFRGNKYYHNTDKEEGRAFYQTGGTLTIKSGITIDGFYVDKGTSGEYAGGAISSGSGDGTTVLNISCTILNCYTVNSSSFGGGAIHSNGTVNLTGATLMQNSATGYGGAIYVYQNNANGGILKIADSTISNNTSKNGGGAIYSNGQSLTISNSTISNNTANNGNGGAIYASPSAITISSSRISNNEAVNGGGLYLSGGSPATISNTTISNNTATSSGGGIYTTRAITTSGTNYISNNTAANGGGICADVSSSTQTYLTLTGTTISENSVSSSGGGVFLHGTCIYGLTGGTIAGNDASIGGGIYINMCPSITLQNLTVGYKIQNGAVIETNYSNWATTGAGIFAATGTNITLSGTVNINGNYAKGIGGGMYLSGGELSSTATVYINGNSATSGGGIYGSSSTITLENTKFQYNYARGTDKDDDGTIDFGGGGAIYSAGEVSLSLTDINFYSNQSAYDGGAVYSNNSSLNISGGSSTNNKATNNGGLIYTQSPTQLEGSSYFAYNFAGNSGGAIYASGSLTVDTYLIRNNSATYGGAIFNTETCTLSLNSGRFMDNSATYGGLVYAEGVVVIDNAYIDGNKASCAGQDVYLIASSYLQIDTCYNYPGLCTVYKEELQPYNSEKLEYHGNAIIAYCSVSGSESDILDSVIDKITVENMPNGRKLSYTDDEGNVLSYIVVMLIQYTITYSVESAEYLAGSVNPSLDGAYQWYTAEDALVLPSVDRSYQTFNYWEVLANADSRGSNWTDGEKIYPHELSRGTEHYGSVILKSTIANGGMEWKEYKLLFNPVGHDQAVADLNLPTPTWLVNGTKYDGTAIADTDWVYIRYNSAFNTAYRYTEDGSTELLLSDTSSFTGIIPDGAISTTPWLRKQGATSKPVKVGSQFTATSSAFDFSGLEYDTGYFKVHAYFPRITVIYHDNASSLIDTADSMSGSIFTQSGYSINLPTATGGKLHSTSTRQGGTPTAARVRYGYTFNGWYSEYLNGEKASGDKYSSTNVCYSNYATPDDDGYLWLKLSDTVLDDFDPTISTFFIYARYTPLTFSVTLSDTGQKIYYLYGIDENYWSTAATNVESLIFDVDVPEHETNSTDYQFVGYYVNENGIGTQYIDSSGYLQSPLCELNDGTVLYPCFELIEYTIKYDLRYNSTHCESVYFTVTDTNGNAIKYSTCDDYSTFTVRPSDTITCWGTSVTQLVPYNGTTTGYYYGIRATIGTDTTSNYKQLRERYNVNKTDADDVSFDITVQQIIDSGYYSSSAIFTVQSYLQTVYGNYTYEYGQDRPNGTITYNVKLDPANWSSYCNTYGTLSFAIIINDPNNPELSMESITTPTPWNASKYQFMGYFTQKNGEGTQYVDGSGGFVNKPEKNITANTTLYAHFTICTYEVDVFIAALEDSDLEDVQDMGYLDEGYHSAFFNKVPYGSTIIQNGQITSTYSKLHVGSWSVTASAYTVTGYTVWFSKWVANDSTIGTSASFTVKSNVTVDAYFGSTKNQYSVTFDPNGGYRVSDNNYDPVTYTYDYGHVETISERRRTGHTLTGYEITDTSGGTNNIGGAEIIDFDGTTAKVKVGAADIIVTAQWTPNKYTLTLKVSNSNYALINDTSASVSLTVVYGTSIVFYASSTSSNSAMYGINGGYYIAKGQTVNGYDVRYTGMDGSMPLRMPAYNVTITFNFQLVAKTYTITYEWTYEGQSQQTETDTYEITDSFKLKSILTTTNGYQSGGWVVKSTTGNWVVEQIYYNGEQIYGGKYGDVTLSMNLTYIIYSIDYDISAGGTLDGTAGTDYSEEYTIASDITLPTITREGSYVFEYWLCTYRGGNWDESSFVKGATFNADGRMGNITFKAVWEVDYEYYTKVTVNVNDGMVHYYTDASYNLNHEDTADDYYIYFRTGSSQIFVPRTSSDVPYKYDPNTGYTYAETGTSAISVTDVSLRAIRIGYSFKGLYSSTGIQLTSGSTFVTNAYYTSTTYISGGVWKYGASIMTVKAEWTAIEYTLTINPNGGSYNGTTDSTDITGTIGSTVTISDPTRPGYTFNGWTRSGLGSLSGSTYTFSASSATLTASWTANYYEVSLNFSGKDVEFYYTQDGEFTTSSIYVYPNSQYLYYGIDSSYKQIIDIWASRGYTCTLTLGGTGVAERTITIGSDGSVGEKFNAAVAFTAQFDPANPSLTLTASWDVITYTITYKDESGYASSVPAALEYNVNESITLGTASSTGGYWQTKWKLASTDSISKWKSSTYDPGQQLSGMYGNVTLMAVWSANIYSISISLGKGVSSVEVFADDALVTSNSVNEDGDPWYDISFNASVKLIAYSEPYFDYAKWYVQDDDTAKCYSNTWEFSMPDDNMWLTPIALGEQYTINFDANGGTLNHEASVTVRYREDYTSIWYNFGYQDDSISAPATRLGYEFFGYGVIDPATGTLAEGDLVFGSAGQVVHGNYFDARGAWSYCVAESNVFVRDLTVNVTALWKVVTYTIEYECLYSAADTKGIYITKKNSTGDIINGYTATGTISFNVEESLRFCAKSIYSAWNDSSIIPQITRHGIVLMYGSTEIERYTNTDSSSVDYELYISGKRLVENYLQNGTDTLYFKSFKYSSNQIGTYTSYGSEECDSIWLLKYTAIWNSGPDEDTVKKFSLVTEDQVVEFNSKGTYVGLIAIVVEFYTDSSGYYLVTDDFINLYVDAKFKLVKPKYYVEGVIVASDGTTNTIYIGNGEATYDFRPYLRRGFNKITLRPYRETNGILNKDGYLSSELDGSNAVASLPTADIGGSDAHGERVTTSTTACTIAKPKETDYYSTTETAYIPKKES